MEKLWLVGDLLGVIEAYLNQHKALLVVLEYWACGGLGQAVASISSFEIWCWGWN